MYLKRVYVGNKISTDAFKNKWPQETPSGITIHRYVEGMAVALQVERKDFIHVNDCWARAQLVYIHHKEWKGKDWPNEIHPLTEFLYDETVVRVQSDLSTKDEISPWADKPFLEAIRHMGSGALSLAGLLDISLRLSDKRKKFVWIRPESALHPLLAERIIPFLADVIDCYGRIRRSLNSPDFNEHLTSSNEMIRTLATALFRELKNEQP